MSVLRYNTAFAHTPLHHARVGKMTYTLQTQAIHPSIIVKKGKGMLTGRAQEREENKCQYRIQWCIHTHTTTITRCWKDDLQSSNPNCPVHPPLLFKREMKEKRTTVSSKIQMVLFHPLTPPDKKLEKMTYTLQTPIHPSIHPSIHHF